MFLAAAGVATPFAVGSYLRFADPTFSFPIQLRPGATLVRQILVHMDDPSHDVALVYDSPQGMMYGYCRAEATRGIEPDAAMPDCAAPPKLAVALVKNGNSAIPKDSEPSCCQFGAGDGAHPAQAGRTLAQAKLEPGQPYTLQVRVMSARPELMAFHPRIEVTPNIFERDAAFSFFGFMVGGLIVVFAAAWAGLALPLSGRSKPAA